MKIQKLAFGIFVLFVSLSAKADSPATMPTTLVEKDIPYIDHGTKTQTLDLFIPKSDHPLPLVIYVHGGGWLSGNKSGYRLMPQVPHRYAVASIAYRLTQEAIFPAQIQDCQAAVRWLRANAKKYNLDPDHFAAYGESAGGHLVALIGTTGGKHIFPAIGENKDESDSVQAVIEWYGPTDLVKFPDQEGTTNIVHANQPDSMIAKLLGGPLQNNLDKALVASPVHYIDSKCPPFLIEHEMEDNVVPVEQSREFFEALRKASVEAILHEVPGKTHGKAICGNKQTGFDLAAGFLDAHFVQKP